jgi:hypothetical protein
MDLAEASPVIVNPRSRRPAMLLCAMGKLGFWIALIGGSTAGLAAGARLPRATELEGTWVKPCTLDPVYDVYRIERMIFTGDMAYVSREFSSQPTCEPIDVVFAGRARFTIGDSVSGVPGARQLDFTFSELFGRAATDDAVEALNGLEICGLTGWQRGVDRDVAGRVCEGSLPNPEIGGRVYHIYEIDGDRLYSGARTGADSDGSAPERRPRALDLTEPFLRQ